ncbi:MAG: adenylate/guanylate cyclase domain-containing protein [Chitinophagaceae bacterium]
MKKELFREQYRSALLNNEKKRVQILLVIFSAGLMFRLVSLFVLSAEQEEQSAGLLSVLWVFPAVIIVFELFTLFFIIRKLKSANKDIPPALQFLNAVFEILVPSVIIYFFAKQYPAFNIPESPVVYIFFVYIILSTLRLNFILSSVYGILAAAVYTFFSVVLYHQFSTTDAARAIILLFSGVAAGFVAKQIRQGIGNTLKEARKRQQTENLFGQQLSAEVAEIMLRNEGEMESRRMRVAILFIDIRNFTGFTAGKTPEEIVKYQNNFLSVVIDTISHHGGIVNQILGDGCMITFGAPVPLPNPAAPAVEAAMDLLTNIASAVQNGSLAPTRVGIGIHAGEAVTGNIGNEERKQYSITGSVVIMASRIEQLNKKLGSQILISEEVMKLAGTAGIQSERCDPVSLNGFEQPVTVYKLA